MRKKLLALTLALGMTAVPFAAYAEDATVTADSLLEKMAEYQQSVGSMSAKMTMNVDGALNMESEDAPASSLGMKLSGEFDIKEINDPMQMAMTGGFNMSVLGQSMDIGMESYVIMNDDGSTMDTYMKMTGTGSEEAEGWIHNQTDMTEMLAQLGVSSMAELQSKSAEELLGGDVELDWTVTEAEDAYELSAALNFSDIMPLIEASMATQGQEIPEEAMELVKMILEAFRMNMSYTLDKETFAPIAVHADMNDSDMSSLNSLIAMFLADTQGAGSDTAAPAMEIELNDFSIDAAYSFDDVAEIVVPEEALAAEVMDVNEMMNEAMAE